MKFSLLKAVGISSALMVGSYANAALIYNDQATFNSELSSFIIDDYSNADYFLFQNDAAMSAVLGESDYTATGFLNNNIVTSSGRYCAGCNGSFEISFTTTSLGTSDGVFGVGLDIAFNDPSFAYDAFITFGDLSTLSVDLGVGSRFFGVTNSNLIKSISFGLDDGLTATTNGYFEIDNLTIGNQTSVPAPSTLAIFTLGVMGIASRRFKKISK